MLYELDHIVLSLLVGIGVAFCVNSWSISLLRCIVIAVPAYALFQGTLLLFLFRKIAPLSEMYYIDIFDYSFKFYVAYYDSISVHFLFLLVFTHFVCGLMIGFKDETGTSNYNYKTLVILFLITELCGVIVFTCKDLCYFYIFFEAILIPMYVMIGYYGSRERRVRASYLFFFYTLCGSLPFLLAILYIGTKLGTFEFDSMMSWNFSKEEQIFLWLAFFFPFASKIPMFPFHIWLPEAHVEAPTVGSVILAAILLKLGVYGFIRFSLNAFPYACYVFQPYVYALAAIGTLYAAIVAMRQTDIKRVIAYSSIAHMNLIVLGIFSLKSAGILGAIAQSISHGFVSAGLFILVGVLYDRYHSRSIFYYGGLTHTMPIFSVIFCIFTMANIALPGTSSFIGEFLILQGVYGYSMIVGCISTLGVILAGGYSLWLYNRVAFGAIKTNYTLSFYDVTSYELAVLLPLIILVIGLGFYPSFFLEDHEMLGSVLLLMNRW